MGFNRWVFFFFVKFRGLGEGFFWEGKRKIFIFCSFFFVILLIGKNW